MDQNMLYYCNRLHEYLTANKEPDIEWTCCPKFVCKQSACMECTTIKGEYPHGTWQIKGCINKTLRDQTFVC